MKIDPVYVTVLDSLGDVARKMAESKKDMAIVRNDKGEIQGLVTSHDLFEAIRTYVLGKQMLEQIPRDIRELKVTSIMKGAYPKEFMEACGLTGTNVCITLWEDEPVYNAIRTMAISGIDHILITGEKGIVGTLSDDDLVKVFLE